nr:GldA_ABC_ATP: gliding motility-associated ABC transporter ATP-binding subunit [uncultured bacterium]
MTTISEPDTMALAVTGVTKHYDSGFVLDDVTFDLPKGYIMGSWWLGTREGLMRGEVF